MPSSHHWKTEYNNVKVLIPITKDQISCKPKTYMKILLWSLCEYQAQDLSRVHKRLLGFLQTMVLLFSCPTLHIIVNQSDLNKTINIFRFLLLVISYQLNITRNSLWIWTTIMHLIKQIVGLISPWSSAIR